IDQFPCDEKGYGWVFPKKKGLSLGVGEFVRGGNRPKRSFENFISHESALAGLSIPSPLRYPIPIAHHQANRFGHQWTGSEVILSQVDPAGWFLPLDANRLSGVRSCVSPVWQEWSCSPGGEGSLLISGFMKV
nr:hypothetical protein [Nitrospirales bacterium]